MRPLKFSNIIPNQNKKTKFIYDVNRIQIESLRTEFPEILKDGFGLFNRRTLTLKVKPETQPKFLQPRKVPFAIIPKVESEIHRLVENTVLVPVEYSEWDTPIVTAMKESGEVRICGDFKVIHIVYAKY